MSLAKVIDVTVAIIQKSTGEFLLASRPQGKGWAGWWEFPGGKIEIGEAPEHALSRELHEELGITPTYIQQWMTRRFDYPQTIDAEAKTVLLHFYFVNAWYGEITPKEGQQLSWQNPQNITVSPILPANAPIMKALTLPLIYAISNVEEMGEVFFLNALENQLKQGLHLIQVREKQLSTVALIALALQVIHMAKPYGAKVLLNNDIKLAKELGADGVHLPSRALMALQAKPADLMVAASCHNALELAYAEKLGLDFVVLSPVKQTKSHENVTTLGWDAFAGLIANSSLPVYALGGMALKDLPQSLICGARGLAMQRALWLA